MSYIIPCYTIYLTVTIAITIWVASTLFRNGKVFLIDIFHGNAPLAAAVNNLLLVGFYLVNIGYAVYTLAITDNINDIRAMIEALSTKIGAIILILGAMHFFNMFVFFKLRKKAIADRKPLHPTGAGNITYPIGSEPAANQVLASAGNPGAETNTDNSRWSKGGNQPNQA